MWRKLCSEQIGHHDTQTWWQELPCHKHFSISETQSAKQDVTRDDVSGGQVSNRTIPVPSTFLIQVTFSKSFIVSSELSSSSLHLPLNEKPKPSHKLHPISLVLVGRKTKGFVASVPPLRIPIYAALNGDYLEGKRSNRYLALALKTLSFNPKTLTATIFPLRRVNHYPNLSSLLSPPPSLHTRIIQICPWAGESKKPAIM